MKLKELVQKRQSVNRCKMLYIAFSGKPKTVKQVSEILHIPELWVWRFVFTLLKNHKIDILYSSKRFDYEVYLQTKRKVNE
jgi:hypothetical protein